MGRRVASQSPLGPEQCHAHLLWKLLVAKEWIEGRIEPQGAGGRSESGGLGQAEAQITGQKGLGLEDSGAGYSLPQIPSAWLPGKPTGTYPLLWKLACSPWRLSKVRVCAHIYATNRPVSLVHGHMIMPPLPPQVCTQACLRSPRHSPRTWSYAHTQNPTSPCRHGRGPASCWHMHTHARTLTNILTCWCGYTPVPISMGSLSDSCQTAALLGICQVPLQAGENEGSAVAWASREER